MILFSGKCLFGHFPLFLSHQKNYLEVPHVQTLFENVQQRTPLVHCITNYVTVSDVANVLLAAGGS